MGTPLTAETLETHQYSASCLENSPSSSLPTPWWPSTSPRRDGTKSRTSRPRPVASPLPRLLPAPLSSTTSTAESTLVTGTPTRISPRSSMPSSRTTTASPLTPSTPPTWTPRRLLETSSPACPCTPPVSVLVATLTDSACPPESPSSRELTLRLSCPTLCPS